MNQPLPEKPIELRIDVEQWRRDIQTFSDTTKRALDAIAAELTNSCNGNFYEREANQRVPTHEGALEPGSNMPSKHGTNDMPGEERLTRLKTQLAQRISKTI